MWYHRKALKNFLQIWYKHPLGLKDENIRPWRSKVKASLTSCMSHSQHDISPEANFITTGTIVYFDSCINVLECEPGHTCNFTGWCTQLHCRNSSLHSECWMVCIWPKKLSEKNEDICLYLWVNHFSNTSKPHTVLSMTLSCYGEKCEQLLFTHPAHPLFVMFLVIWLV